MKNLKHLMLLTALFLFGFAFHSQTEAKVVVNQVALELIDASIFKFYDGPIMCVGTFHPNVNINCNRISGDIPLRMIIENPLYRNERSTSDSLGIYRDGYSEIQRRFIDSQVCYTLNKNIFREQENRYVRSNALSCVEVFEAS